MSAGTMRRELPFAAGLIAGLTVLVLMGMVQARADLLPASDFAGIWAGARAVVLGHDPYDASSWRQTTELMGSQPPDTNVYGYPAYVALALVPLAVLPLPVAAAIWTAAGMTIGALGLRTLIREREADAATSGILAFTLFASQPALTAFHVGQWSFLLTGLISFAATQVGRRSLLFTVIASLAKPQLAILSLPALSRSLRRFAVAIVAMGAVLGISTILFPDWLTAWSANVAPARIAVPPRSATLFGLCGEVFGQSAPIVATLIAVGLAGAVRARGTGLPGWLALSVAAAPYGWSYDHLLLLVPLGLTVTRTSGRRRLVVLGIGALLLVALAPLMYSIAIVHGRESLSGIVPVAMLLLTMSVTERRP